MSNFSYTSKCPECYGNEINFWKDEEINSELIPFRDSYISPVKRHYDDLDSAMRAWGEEIIDETDSN